jgi:hypothetical protein
MTAAVAGERVWIEQVYPGEDLDPARRGSKTLVARSECAFDCKDDETLDRCVEAIKKSDENLRKRPQQSALYDWQTFRVARRPAGGGVLTLGVAWYDEEFFNSKHEVYLNRLHHNMFDHIGIEAGGISISHWKLVGQGAL